MRTPSLNRWTRLGLWALLWVVVLPLLTAVQPTVYADSTAPVPTLYIPVAHNGSKDAPDLPQEIESNAKMLALKVAAATTDAAREAVLLEIFAAVNLGVYTAQGAVVQRGAERGVGDFYLYDVQVKMMATALGRQQANAGSANFTVDAETIGGDGMWGIYDLAAALNEWGELTPDKEFTPEELYGVLVEGVQWAAQNPNEPLAFVPLLVRELGRTHAQPYDLLATPELSDVRFDAAQWFMILGDFLLPAIWEAGPIDTDAPGATSQVVALSNGVLSNTPLEAPHPCTAIGNVVSEKWEFGKWALAFYGKTANYLGKSLVWIDAIHGSILAYGVYVYSPDKVVRGHYGHNGPADPMTFRTKVFMVDDLPENLIQCAWLAGVTLPPKGPIADVLVLWATEDLDDHGNFDCGWPCGSKTGADGIASLVFTPFEEVVDPGVGILVEETGTTTGVAMYQSKHKNVVGTVNQVFTPKSGEARWFIEYHRPPGWSGIVTLTEVKKVYTYESTTDEDGHTRIITKDQLITEKHTWNLVTDRKVTETYFAMNSRWNVTLKERTVDTEHNEGLSYWCGTYAQDTTKTRTGTANHSERSDLITLDAMPGGTYNLQNIDLKYGREAGSWTNVEHRESKLEKNGENNCENTVTEQTQTGTYSFSERGPFNVSGEMDPDNPDVIEGKKVFEVEGGITQTWNWRLVRQGQ